VTTKPMSFSKVPSKLIGTTVTEKGDIVLRFRVASDDFDKGIEVAPFAKARVELSGKRISDDGQIPGQTSTEDPAE